MTVIVPPPYPTTSRWQACRVRVELTGTGVWAGETATWGVMVAPLPSGATITYNGGFWILPPVWSWADGRAATIASGALSVDRGWQTDSADGPGGTQWQDTIATATWTAWTGSWRNRISSMYRLAAIRLRPFSDNPTLPAPPATVYRPTAVSAGAAAQTAPPQAAIKCALHTAARARVARSRMSIGPFSRLDIGADGRVTSGGVQFWRNAITGWFNALRLPFQDPPQHHAIPVVWQRTGPLARDITRVSVSDEIGTLRGRGLARADVWSSDTLFPL